MNAIITENLRIAAKDREYILQRRHIVDPTKAPGYKAAEDGSIPESRVVWRDIGYYPANSTGLVAAVNTAIIREVTGRYGDDETVTLAEMLAEYKAESARLATVIESAFNSISEVSE